MLKTPEVIFKGVDHSDAIERSIRHQIARLGRRFPQIVRCTVVVDALHRHAKPGRLYSISVDLDVLGRNLILRRDRRLDRVDEDVDIAIRKAFAAAKKQVRADAPARRPLRRAPEKKRNDIRPYGVISELAPSEGRIESGDGHSIYFHRNVLKNASFTELAVGQPVFFAAVDGEKGLEASTVRLLSAPGHPRPG